MKSQEELDEVMNIRFIAIRFHYFFVIFVRTVFLYKCFIVIDPVIYQ